MKTNDKNSLKSKNVNFRITEIREAIEQIKIHLSEIENASEINSIRYLVGSEMIDVKIYLRRFESHLKDLSDLFD